MSPRWLSFLERIGNPIRRTLPLDRPLGPDASLLDLQAWHGLFRVFGPVAGGPWEPWHCPTLFAAMDRGTGPPIEPAPLPEILFAPRPPGTWQWLLPHTAVWVDMQGPLAVQAGAVLVMEAGAQPICTFDHWPHRTSPVIPSTDLLATMAALAQPVHQARAMLAPNSPPVWICDRRRLTSPRPAPGHFDNRYYIDDSILPGLPLLRRHGIRRLVWMTDDPSLPPLPDIGALLFEASEAGLEVLQVHLSVPQTWIDPLPLPMTAPPRLVLHEFQRSDVGGFGHMIPDPEGGGYSSGSYGG
jgi:hypothetical protein